MKLNDPNFPTSTINPTLTDKALGVIGGLVKLMTFQQIKNLIGVTVENVLDSTSTVNALSAAQGKALNDILADKCPLVDGKVPSVNLPSYVDDALEFANLAAFPVTGESGKIYIAIDTEIDYRWTGSVYVPIGQTPDVVGIGATAFPRYDVSQSLSTAQKEQLTANIGVFDPTINNQTGTAYTLQTVATDNDGKTIVRMNNAASNTCTIPSTQTKTVTVRQVGAGVTTLVADSGVTLNGNLVFSGANDAKSIVPVGGGVFDVYGAQ